MILARFASGDAEFEETFRRHLHFGYWEDPDNAYEDRDESIFAMERFCQRILTLAEIEAGQDVLDVGCGLGGTLACIDERFSPVRLTGLNIDARQLEVARQRVTPHPGNRIDWVVGDACAMPFPDASFDRVTAVECIFHFPSRLAFFQHARRVLRPGGNLTISDFVRPEGAPSWDTDDPLWGTHTAIDLQGYLDLAEQVGLVPTHVEDISRHTRPTYYWFGKLFEPHFPGIDEVLKMSRLVVDAGGLGYCTLRFDLK